MAEFYTVQEVAKQLRCDKHRIYSYIHKQQLKAVKIGVTLIREDWYEEFIENMIVAA